MTLTRLTLRGPEEWRQVVESHSPTNDVYSSPEYVAASETIQESQGECLVAHGAGASLALTYLKCPIPNVAGWYDVQSAYGYGGPLVMNATPGFLADAWQTIKAAWQEDHVVAAFLRLNPMSENVHWLGSDWAVRADRTTISIDLRNGLEAAFEGAAAKNHRRTVLKALRLGYRASIEPLNSENLAIFIRMYYQSMSRLSAGAYYYFPESYFHALVEKVGSRLSLHVVWQSDGQTPAAMMLFLWDRMWGHAHLSWRKDGEDNCTTNLIFQSGAAEGVERGVQGLHLGGGRTSDPADRLLEFKERVGQVRHQFYTAGMVACETVHEELLGGWREKHQGAEPTWFLGYRQTAPVGAE